jgi:hypothetical protein
MINDYEYSEVAERILDIIKKCEAQASRVTPNDLQEVVGENVNCYPGISGNKCYPIAFFVSLTSSRCISPRGGHLGFRKALEKFVQHMQGHCRGLTKVAVLIFDSWDPIAFSDWHSNIEQAQRDGAHVEVFQITGNNITPIKCGS